MTLGLKGIVSGILMAAPIGPVALICFRKTLKGYTILALVTGFGAAFADALLALFACLGFQAISGFWEAYSTPFRLIGGGGMVIFGLVGLWRKPDISQGAQAFQRLSLNFLSSFWGAFFLTLCNPATILAFAATFSALEITLPAQSPASLGLLICSVLVGSLAWWSFLVALSRMVRKRFGLQDVWKIHQAVSLVFIVLGGSLVALVIFQLFQRSP